jgi:HAD superfamily hydrolase (TIGR01484 family)
MKPVEQLSHAEARRLEGVLFDMDDTLLDRGALSPEALDSLYRLHDAGLILMVVTGRPATWGSVLVRQWPVRAAVMENGAIGVYREGGGVRFLDRLTREQRALQRVRVQRLSAELQQRFPELRCADEHEGRISDYAFERRRVDSDIVSSAIALARERGFRTSRSSVHLHVTLDGDDKASGSIRVLQTLLGTDPTVARDRFAFIGDSGNDAACFAAFHTTIAPSNLSGRPTIPPRFVAAGESGVGFAQAARVILQARASA